MVFTIMPKLVTDQEVEEAYKRFLRAFVERTDNCTQTLLDFNDMIEGCLVRFKDVEGDYHFVSRLRVKIEYCEEWDTEYPVLFYKPCKRSGEYGEEKRIFCFAVSSKFKVMSYNDFRRESKKYYELIKSDENHCEKEVS